MMITVRVTCRRGLEVLTASSVTLNEFFMKFWNLSNLLGGFFNWKQRRNRINTYWVRFFVMSGSNWKRDESYKKVLFVLLLFVRNRVRDKIYRQEGIGSERRVWHLQETSCLNPLLSHLLTHCRFKQIWQHMWIFFPVQHQQLVLLSWMQNECLQLTSLNVP